MDNVRHIPTTTSPIPTQRCPHHHVPVPRSFPVNGFLWISKSGATSSPPNSVSFTETHCPHICFCERAPPQIYNPRPLKLENVVPNAPSTVISDPGCVDGLSVCKSEVKDRVLEEKTVAGNDCLKSILRKTPLAERKEVQGKQVRWVDFAGKELVEIREFVFSETDSDDRDIDMNRSCECVIL